jgi:hypothetical protein
MRSKSLFFSVVAIVLWGCSQPEVPPLTVQRLPASADECATFNKLSAAEKLLTFMDRHTSTAISPGKDQLALDAEAGLATARFLSPALGTHETLGHGALDHTLTLSCDTLPQPQVKMVHAMGTLASAHMLLYPQLRKLNPSGVMTDEIDNPWSGLLNPLKNGNLVPLLIRFSIANPLLHTLSVDGKSYALEFIPGLGLKFLVDGQKSVDLLAMESLAGQGSDHNYFKYEFSPDFSAHAPPGFNTASEGDEKTEILERYDHNLVNEKVMGWVGERFFQAMMGVYHLDAQRIDRHSPAGPNPFIVSLQGLARVDKVGRTYSDEKQKRPWRLVLKPALDNIDAPRLDKIRDPAPFSSYQPQADFRVKLSHLRAGDRVFYVLAETQAGSRYAVGEIILDSTPFPSKFSDREFFIQHEIDLDRSNGAANIADPSS